jgi:sortase A
MKSLPIILVIVGLVALSYCAAVLVRAHLYQAREARRFIDESREEPSPADASVPRESSVPARPPHPSTGSAVAKLAIPRLGLAEIVLEGAGERELKLGPGHIAGTSLPGDGGNVGVAGHRDTFFRPLRSIRANDKIELTTREQKYRYIVVSTAVVEPSDVEVLRPWGHETLTLVTCYPFNFIGSAPKRFIVRADCINCVK